MKCNMEIWKDIPTYKGRYQVSSHGNVRSLPRLIHCKGRKAYQVDGRIMKQYTSPCCRYKIVDLCKDGVRKHILVHILVARTFLNNDDTSLEVNHKDGNVLNNHISNLELVTHQQNIDHSVHEGLKHDYGEKHVHAKLTNLQAEMIRYRHQLGEKQKDLAVEYGVCKQTINCVIHHKTYFK